jgi:hypothetical protein
LLGYVLLKIIIHQKRAKTLLNVLIVFKVIKKNNFQYKNKLITCPFSNKMGERTSAKGKKRQTGGSDEKENS